MCSIMTAVENSAQLGGLLVAIVLQGGVGSLKMLSASNRCSDFTKNNF
jgi:hypothetical protein